MIRLVVLFWLMALGAHAETIRLASTTSTQNSGLLDWLLPRFTAETGISVEVIAVGTGQALRLARNGDADVLLVHHRRSEDAFVAEGWGVGRRDVMYNDFVLVGPEADPAGIGGLAKADAALRAIASAGVETAAVFVSRGDESGTHRRERELWAAAGVVPEGNWYRETGAGMGTTLNIAVAMEAYLLTDRGTWITFGNKGDLAMLLSGDPALFNPYGVILVNPERHPHVKAEAGQALIDWLVSDEGQGLIAEFQIEGRQAFCPIAAPVVAEGEAAGICPADQ